MSAKSFMLPSTVLLAVVLMVISTMAASSALTTVSATPMVRSISPTATVNLTAIGSVHLAGITTRSRVLSLAPRTSCCGRVWSSVAVPVTELRRRRGR